MSASDGSAPTAAQPGERSVSRGHRADLLCALAVVLANPVLQRFGDGIRAYTSPDVAAYGSLARVLANDGLVYLKGWGTTDQAVILSPLFPALWALVAPFASAPLEAGLIVSGAAAIGAGLAFFALASRLSNRIVALALTLCVQTGFDYYYYAFAPLTESLFTLAAAWALFALFCFVARGRLRAGVALGGCCALVLLSRKAGVFVVASAGLWIFISACWDRRPGLPAALARVALVALVAALLIAPYAVILYGQTGQHPLQPRFRLGEYAVGTDDPRVIAEIAAIDTAIEGVDYRTVWRARRQLRKLLPDASEMYMALSPMPGAPTEPQSVMARVATAAFERPAAVIERLWVNLGRLRSAVGWPLFALFIVTTISPLVERLRSHIPSSRFLLAAFNWTYLICVSIVTDHLDRYIVVVVPLVALQGAVEAYALAITGFSRRALATAVAVGVVATSMLLRPRDFTDVWLEDFPVPTFTPYAKLREHLPAGEPVLAPAPLDALLLGAGYRALPNSGLEPLVRYGLKTGVRYVVVTDLFHNRQQVQLYDDSWYLWPSPRREIELSRWLEKRASAGRGRYALYRIRGIWPGRPPASAHDR